MENLKEKSVLLSIKECDLREDALYQCRTSVDRGIHIGGAYSAISPMTALYYGGFMKYDPTNPTSHDQDMFILSKGHAIAALASVFADVGYFDRKHLKNTRGYGALIKGHPGPVIPGVPVSTGPLGHGISLAAGYAVKRKEKKNYNVYCLVGDGELQEGSCWEGIMFAGDRKLGNLCIIVDKNNGQSDNTKQLSISMKNLDKQFEAFGFRVLEAESDNMGSMLVALDKFTAFPGNSKPTVIICNSTKGLGGFAELTNKHKASLDETLLKTELKLLLRGRQQQVDNLNQFSSDTTEILAKEIGYQCIKNDKGVIIDCERNFTKAHVQKPGPHKKGLCYDTSALPVIDASKEYAATGIISKTMSAFGQDPHLYSIDADLSNASGLFDGTKTTNRHHAINTGIAECNMMCMAEAFASEGDNVWVSTFAPFFNWQALRRIAVSYQERAEVIATNDGWLDEGHNLDITFIATAANLDTAVNGATHMGNDDICFFSQLAQIKLIDISCPQQLLTILKWIAEGNKGLVYIRTMRNKSRVLYKPDFKFEYGKGYYLRNPSDSKAVIISSGHGVAEALAAADQLQKEEIPVAVLDMPSFDSSTLETLIEKKIPVLFAEQNNGYLFNKFSQHLLQNQINCDPRLILHLNTMTRDHQLQFIQSGTYDELTNALELTSGHIIKTIKKSINQKK